MQRTVDREEAARVAKMEGSAREERLGRLREEWRRAMDAVEEGGAAVRRKTEELQREWAEMRRRVGELERMGRERGRRRRCVVLTDSNGRGVMPDTIGDFLGEKRGRSGRSGWCRHLC